MKSALLWMAVLPAAVLGGILSCIPLRILVLIVCSNSPDSMLQNKEGISLLYLHRDEIERFLLPMAFSLAFVFTGARIAPSHHFKTGIILLIGYILLAGLVAYSIASNYFNVQITSNYWGMFVGITGGLFALWIVKVKSPEWTKH